MQQGMKMPKKEGETTMREQVRADLEAAGVPISKDLKLYGENKAIYDNPEPLAREQGVEPDAVRAEILEDLIAIIEGDINKIQNARAESPGIHINERNPEYREAMDDYVKGLQDTLGELKKARLDFVDEYKKA